MLKSLLIILEQEDFALKVADAPNVAMNRVATYKELDNDLFKHAAFATLEEIDLRCVVYCVVQSVMIKPPILQGVDAMSGNRGRPG